MEQPMFAGVFAPSLVFIYGAGAAAPARSKTYVVRDTLSRQFSAPLVCMKQQAASTATRPIRGHNVRIYPLNLCTIPYQPDAR